MSTVLIVLVAIAAVICFPLATIWALNTLFAVGIAYTFKTWLAAFLLALVVGSSSRAGSKA